MHRFDNKSYKEIAEILQVSPKTVDYRIQQAVKTITDNVERLFAVDPAIVTQKYSVVDVTHIHYSRSDR